MTKNYAALADTIKIEDITSYELNRQILHRLKNNDESFDNLYIISESSDDDEYIPIDGEDIGWLGYYIGQNTKLKCLYFFETIDNESFYKEISHNKSIKEIHFNENSSMDANMIRMLDPFLKKNHNLTRITIIGCEFGIEGRHQLLLAIGNCNKLKHVEITNNEMVDGQLVDIITALSMHPQLEELDLSENWTIGRNECTALSTLLRCTTTQLKTLILYWSGVNDVGIEVLVPALRGHTLQRLNLGSNRLITIQGWKALSTLFESPGNLEDVLIHGNHIGDDGALVFAEALTNNRTLKKLHLSSSNITKEGWTHFSKLLCDTSSVNNTYLSNHTLRYLGETEGDRGGVNASLDNNKRKDKQQVAMIKILKHHSHFNIEPFFEWEFKVLPIMMKWYAKAADVLCLTFAIDKEKINKMKLSVVYDFIKGFPMLYIESVTRKEIAEYTALEKQLQGGEELEKIRQRKARALRRL